MYHHKKIHHFTISGIIKDDASIPRLKQEFIRVLKDEIENDGYVIRVDINPDFTIQYADDQYEFTLTVYAVHVGKKKALCLNYIDEARPHFKSPKSLLHSLQQG